MSARRDSPIPTELKLNRKQRMLKVSFDDGSRFNLTCEYLRVYSPAAEAKVARTSGEWITGKQSVNIERITPG